MTSKARHMRSRLQDRAISVDELFSAAFHNPHFDYERQSLLGWRPVTHDCKPPCSEKDPPSSLEDKIPYNNSPDISVQDTPEAILIEIILPDIHEDSLYLEVSGDLLIVRAEKAGLGDHRSETDGKNGKPMVHRYVKLPVAAQPGSVQARLENHVLRVIINKPWTGR